MIRFPKDFVWGTSTSAFQIEGAWLEGEKDFLFGMYLHIFREKF